MELGAVDDCSTRADGGARLHSPLRRGEQVALGEGIYHLAGVPHVGESWTSRRGRWWCALAGNVVGTLNLFDGLRDAGLAPRVLVTGSAAIYRPSTGALSEDAPLSPNAHLEGGARATGCR